MAEFELLNSEKHQKLRLRQSVDNLPPYAPIVLDEIPLAACSGPIMLTKEPEQGTFYICTILSLKSGEDHLKTIEERGGFDPLVYQCNGFYIDNEKIVIDTENPRFSSDAGDLLFSENGEPNQSLKKIQFALGKFHSGLEQTEKFVNVLNENALIEAVDLNLNFDKGEKLNLKGLYTISLDKLAKLSDEVLLSFTRNGYLGLIYIISASMNQFSVLANIRNQKLKSKG